MTINEATMQELEAARQRLHALVDGHTQAQEAAWEQSWATLEGEWEIAALMAALAAEQTPAKRVTRKQLATDERLVGIAGRTSQAVGGLVVDLRPREASVREVVDAAGASERALIGSQLQARGAYGAVVPVVSAEVSATEALVRRFSDRMIVGWEAIPGGARAAMSTALLRGFRAGAAPDVTARRVVEEVGVQFRVSRVRASTVTRTEFLDAHRAGALATDRANASVLAGWQHVCTLDVRTCAACLSLHGSVHPVEEPGPLDHQNGRCTRVPVTRSWAELGFPGVEEPADILPDARAWFDALTQSERERVLGKRRLALLDSGRVEWADLASRRETSRWRASYVPTSLRDLEKRAKAKGVRS